MKKKSHFFIKFLLTALAFCGITFYSASFPKTMELLDDAVTKVIKKEFTAFLEYSLPSKKVLESAEYYFELIEENLKGSFEEIKPISEFIITSAAKFPVESKNITSTFGKREDPFLKNESHHNGIDISAPPGSDVCSSWPGIILETGFDEIYGNYVIIEHSEEFFTKYCHLSKICAEEKAFVNAGEKIGKAGSTGRSTGSHLHFEVIINGINIDPKECLEF